MGDALFTAIVDIEIGERNVKDKVAKKGSSRSGRLP
jgi:hypothetical protein